MKGTDIMKVKDVIKKIGNSVKEVTGDFIEDTGEYLSEHPMVFGAIVQGGFILLVGGVLYGAVSAQKEIVDAYETNVFKSLANGKKFKKDMTFNEGMKYLKFYNTKGNNWKKCLKYLRENGYID